MRGLVCSTEVAAIAKSAYGSESAAGLLGASGRPLAAVSSVPASTCESMLIVVLIFV